MLLALSKVQAVRVSLSYKYLNNSVCIQTTLYSYTWRLVCGFILLELFTLIYQGTAIEINIISPFIFKEFSDRLKYVSPI